MGRVGGGRGHASAHLRRRRAARRRDRPGPAARPGRDRGARPHARAARRAAACRRRRRRPGHLRRAAAHRDQGHPHAARPLRARARAPRDGARHAGARHLPRHADAQRRGAAATCTSTYPTSSATTSTATTPGSYADHDVRLRPGRSPRARSAPGARGVKSHHHQGPDQARRGHGRDRLGRRRRRVEALELPERRFALGVLWHPEEDEASRVIGALRAGGAGAHGVARAVTTVVEPATEAGAARAAHGRRGGDRRRRRPRPRRLSRRGARLRRPTARASCAAWPTRSRRARERLATLEARNAGKPIADARGEMGMVVETFRYYAGAPERLLGDTIPVAGGVDLTFREPLGVVASDRPVELPAHDRRLEARARARRRQHGRAQAGRAHAADRARVRAHRARGRAARGRRQRRRRARAACAGSGSSSTPTSPRSPSPARPRSGAGSRQGAADTIKRVTLELGGKSANVVFADADLGARRGRRPARRVRQRRPGLLRALADPRRAARPSTTSWPPSSAVVTGIRVGDPLDEATADGAAHLRRPARDGRLVRSRRRTRRDPRRGPGRRRLLVPADGPLRRSTPATAPRVEEIFGPVAVVIPFEGEEEADRAGQRHHLRPLGLDLDARRSAGAARRARDRYRRALDQLQHLGARLDAVRRLQAVGHRPRARAARARALHRGQERLSTRRG